MKSFLFWVSIGVFGALPALGQTTEKPQNVEQLLSRMEATAAELQDYTVIGEGESNGKPVRYKFYFKQPDLVRIDTHSAAEPQPNKVRRPRSSKCWV